MQGNNAITQLALMFKERENSEGYSPVFGELIDIADLKIRINDRIILDETYVTSCVDLYETDVHGNYIHFGKTVVLLPCSNYQKYIVVGVVV